MLSENFKLDGSGGGSAGGIRSEQVMVRKGFNHQAN
jgi:hypothetical protein